MSSTRATCGKRPGVDGRIVNQSYPHIAYISFGSNLGSRFENCTRGLNELARSGKVDLLQESKRYETEPVDFTDQNWFVNGAVKIATALEPLELLKLLKEVETKLGRKKSALRFGPRILDMDIILYDEVVMRSPTLTIPHPRMHKRRFVLRPICDIAPDRVHPVLKQKMRVLLDKLDDSNQKVVQR